MEIIVNKRNKVRDVLLLNGFSRDLIRDISKLKGQILVNGKPQFANFFCNKGDVLFVDIHDEQNSLFLPQEKQLDIVYEDEYMLIVNKPFEIPTVCSKNHQVDTLSNYVLFYMLKTQPFAIVRPVNRLDICTSGLVIFAKNPLIQYKFQQPKYKIKKYYYALLSGKVKLFGKIDKPIAKSENEFATFYINSEGKRAITKYVRLKYKNGNSFVKIKLITGRTHQIRLHFASIGHGVVGDSLYNGVKQEIPPRQIKLQAYKLKFLHPITNKKIVISIKNVL